MIVEVGNVAFAPSVVEIVQVDTLGEVTYVPVADADESIPATTLFEALAIDKDPEVALPRVKASAGNSPVGDKEIAPTRAAMETVRLLTNIETISIPL